MKHHLPIDVSQGEAAFIAQLLRDFASDGCEVAIESPAKPLVESLADRFESVALRLDQKARREAWADEQLTRVVTETFGATHVGVDVAEGEDETVVAVVETSTDDDGNVTVRSCEVEVIPREGGERVTHQDTPAEPEAKIPVSEPTTIKFNQPFGVWLKEFREGRGLYQWEVAEALADAGVFEGQASHPKSRQSAVSQIENGRRDIDPSLELKARETLIERFPEKRSPVSAKPRGQNITVKTPKVSPVKGSGEDDDLIRTDQYDGKALGNRTPLSKTKNKFEPEFQAGTRLQPLTEPYRFASDSAFNVLSKIVQYPRNWEMAASEVGCPPRAVQLLVMKYPLVVDMMRRDQYGEAMDALRGGATVEEPVAEGA